MKKGMKLIALILTLVLFAAMAMGSGSDSSGSGSGSSSGSVSGSPGAKEPSGEKESSGKTEEVNVTIEEQVLFEQDGIRVTAKEYESGGFWGDGIKLLIENDSEHNVTVSCDALIVNNYMISDLFSASVAAGKKSNDTLNLLSSELKAAGISTVGQIEAYFRVYDSDSWEDMFKTGNVTIQTSEFGNMDVTPDDTGFELLNENGIRICARYVDEDSFWGAAVLLYCENNSGRNITITADDLSVNGFMVTSYCYITVYDGKMAFDDITLLSSDLKENDIEKIEEIELKFHIIDADSWNTVLDTSTLTFTVSG